MTRIARIDHVFRHIERAARKVSRTDLGENFRITFQTGTSGQWPQITIRMVDLQSPESICPYIIFRADDSQETALVEVFTKDLKQQRSLTNEKEFEKIKQYIEKRLVSFLQETAKVAAHRQKHGASAGGDTANDELVAIEVDSRIHLTNNEAGDVKKMLGGIFGDTMDEAKPIVVDHDFELEEEEVPQADGQWREGDKSDGEKREPTTWILAKKKHTVVAERYVLRKLLGAGGMGAVFIADDRQADQKVAVKILHPTLADDQTVLHRFFREVQLIKQVEHPNVISTFDHGSYDKVIFYTMEYVRGLPLNKIVQGRKLRKDALITFATQISLGLIAIHKANIIHRDLKGENVLVTKSKQVKIIDFGIARTEDSNLTSMGEVIGSPAYLAPELWRGETPTTASDIYALGIIFYRMAYGKLPFSGDNPVSVMNKHLHEQPNFSKDLVTAAPPWFIRLIQGLLDKDASVRPTMPRVLELLQNSE